MHVIISHQQVIFTNLISFYKFFNDIYFTHVIFLLGLMWVVPQMVTIEQPLSFIKNQKPNSRSQPLICASPKRSHPSNPSRYFKLQKASHYLVSSHSISKSSPAAPKLL